jgi:hypothetical protein
VGALSGPLVRGYALDALRAAPDALRAAPGKDVPDAAAALEWLAAALGAKAHRSPATGLGERVRFEGPYAGGTGLAIGDGLVQAGVYAR